MVMAVCECGQMPNECNFARISRGEWLHVFDSLPMAAEFAGTQWVFGRYFSMTTGISWAVLSPGMLGVPVIVHVSLDIAW
jgi:hypothetical protein